MSRLTIAIQPDCCAAVWKRDTYRYTGRGPNGFEMHYNKKQCKRKATNGLFCWQHQSGYFPQYETGK